MSIFQIAKGYWDAHKRQVEQQQRRQRNLQFLREARMVNEDYFDNQDIDDEPEEQVEVNENDGWRNRLTFSFTIRFKGEMNVPKDVDRMNEELNWKQYTNRLMHFMRNSDFAEDCRLEKMSIYNFGELMTLLKENRLSVESFDELFNVYLSEQNTMKTPQELITKAYNQSIDHWKSSSTSDRNIMIQIHVLFNEQFCEFPELMKSMKPLIGWMNTIGYILCHYTDKVDTIDMVHNCLPSSNENTHIAQGLFDNGKNPINGSKAMMWRMAQKMYPGNEYYTEPNRKIYVQSVNNSWLLDDKDIKYQWIAHIAREMMHDPLFEWRIVGYNTSVRGTYDTDNDDNYALITIYIRNVRDRKKNTVKELKEHLERILHKLTRVEVQQIIRTVGDQGLNFLVVYMTEPEKGLQALPLPTGHPRSLNKNEYSFDIPGVGFPCDVDILDNSKEYRLFRNSNLTNVKAQHPYKLMHRFIDGTNNGFYKIEDLIEEIQGDNWTLPNVPEIKGW